MRTLAAIAIAFLFALPLQSQTPDGMISGVVKDSETGRALEGANVVLRGTLAGAATDRNGTFMIRGLLPRAYTVVVSMVGFKPAVIGDVRVTSTEHPELSVSLVPTVISTGQIVVTASRREQEMSEVPASLAVITARALADRNIVTMDEAMRHVPGVTVLQDQINIRGSSGYSRGVGSRVLLLLDGLPFLTGDTGEINWEVIPVGDVEQVEVIKGAGSALYGSSALGGVINVITRRPPEEREIRFRLYSGIYDNPPYPEWEWTTGPRFRSGVQIGYADRIGSTGYLLSVGRSIDDGYRENDTYRRWTVFAKGQTDLSEGRQLSAVFNMLKRSHGNFFWWKSQREATRPAEAQRDGLVESTRGNVSLSFRESISDHMFYIVKGMYFGNFWKDYSRNVPGNVSSSHRTQGEVQMTIALAEQNILTLGVAANGDYVESNLFGVNNGLGAAAYVQDEWTLGTTRWTAGVRYDYQRASSVPSATRLSPKIGLSVDLDPRTTFRAVLAAGFRYPSIGELFISSASNVSQFPIKSNPGLRPEKSISAEAGMFVEISPDLSLDMAVFWNEMNDLIEARIDTTETPVAAIKFENITKARIMGIDLNVNVAWLDGMLGTETGYTLLWPEDVAQGEILRFRSRHTLHSTTSLTTGDFRLSADYRFISRVDRVDDELIRLAPIEHGQSRVPIHVLDLRGSFQWASHGLPVRLGVIVSNALNYQYVELIGNLAPPRMYSLVLEGSF